MPAKNKIKTDKEDGIYYIYNKGIDGKQVFLSPEDYEFFEKTVERYLDYKTESVSSRFKADRPYILRHKQEMSLKGKLDIMAYCLNTNGIKLIVEQKEAGAMAKFMRRCMTNYVMYYNKKYQRRGGLFEGVYKAVLVEDAEDVVQLSKWVHMNKSAKTVRRFGIVETTPSIDPEEFLYSSLGVYLSKRENSWVVTKNLERMFDQWAAGRWKSYREYVADTKDTVEAVLGKYKVE